VWMRKRFLGGLVSLGSGLDRPRRIAGGEVVWSTSAVFTTISALLASSSRRSRLSFCSVSGGGYTAMGSWPSSLVQITNNRGNILVFFADLIGDFLFPNKGSVIEVRVFLSCKSVENGSSNVARGSGAITLLAPQNIPEYLCKALQK